RVDILSWLSKATLDIIGLAGTPCFNYNFNSLASENQTELAAAFSTIFYAGMRVDALRMFKARFPVFRAIRTKMDRVLETSQGVMRRIGLQLLQDSKTEMAESGTFEKGRARDLLSLLVRANTSKDIPASQRLSDEDVLAQVPTFLVAGHETTSTATTWALFALTQNTAAQTRLRNELLAVTTDNPTMDELNALPYLDCVVRETLRLHAPVPATVRVATQDDVVPLARPFTAADGTVHESLKVTKGQTVMVPIVVLNRSKGIWGPDAAEFIPERWESEISNSLPGVWGHMLSFLGGPRACIGYRFSLVEMKALVFTLVRAFEFELAVPAADIGKKLSIVQRPIVRSEPGGGNQLPLLIKPHVRL
ncbi:cytochrome P450, partial [Mycena vitilis]